MRRAELASETDFEGWREAARAFLLEGVPPDAVGWVTPDAPPALALGPGLGLGAAEEASGAAPVAKPVVPPAFLDKARRAAAFRDPERWARLYRLLWRMQRERGLLDRPQDADTAWLLEADKAVRRDIHKMHAFVRFREAGEGANGRERFAAWFEPTHRITELATPFFTRRFPNMDWVIVTPERTASWDGEALRFGPGGTRADVPADDAVEAAWTTYFSTIFNPARLKVGAMKAEMPVKYWRNLPEAAVIPELIANAQKRTQAMQDQDFQDPNPMADLFARRAEDEDIEGAALPETLGEARAAVDGCRRCDLWRHASQAVFGEGPPRAKLMLVGEQPGDQEDLAGRPFIGPAGQLLSDCMEEAGLERGDVYITNAVKHFKFQARGKRRIHAKPNAGEIDACRFWLEFERSRVQPQLVVCLGASAARGVFGKTLKIGENRSKPIDLDSGGRALITVHPSYLLRLPREDMKRTERARFIEDLSTARELVAA